MKKRYMFLFFTSFLFTFPSFGQIKGHYGIEAGVSFSQFAFNDNKNNVLLSGNIFTDTKERDVPIAGAVFGITTQIELKGNWVCDVALQYQSAGRTLTDNSVAYEGTSTEKTLATDDFTEKQTFNKLALPVAIGYNWDLGKRQLGFS